MLAKLSDYTMRSIIADKTGVEGGYVDDPNDSGGETNHGITVGLANQYASQLKQMFSWDGTMRNLSLDAAFWLYQVHFWNKLMGDQVAAVHPLIADKLFDISINTGKSPAVTMLQNFLNCANFHGRHYPDITVDGGMGPGTVAALQAFVKRRGNEGIQRLLTSLICSQGDYYLQLTIKREKDEDFFYGWMGRVTRDMGHYSLLLGLAQ